MKSEEKIYRVKSITELHAFGGLEKPRHPLISIVDYSRLNYENAPQSGRFACEFYSINFKSNCSFHYGRQLFDHQEGTMLCTAPEQIIQMEKTETVAPVSGWGLFFHPEFIRNTALGKNINSYAFFRYDEKEALHLSDEESQILLTILKNMEREYQTNLDRFSQQLLISNLELLLNYCLRFYGRQFITRTNQNKDVISTFERFLTGYIYSDELKKAGPPSVKLCADKMNLSPNYLSDLLKSETGRNTMEHIHYHLLDRAKMLLANSNSTINEIAIELGFEYPQNLSKLFKIKTGFTPTEYRNSMLN